ncbi:unnamed protein product [Prorocentrum cordatum]|uniref:Uncharacterized protein n=1 Tax=Prorocentrum cordatum TaxID=2364126 RepID=A0ABN9TM72_9DINO|nr:unnamed protein product [Polarella glacialis]
MKETADPMRALLAPTGDHPGELPPPRVDAALELAGTQAAPGERPGVPDAAAAESGAGFAAALQSAEDSAPLLKFARRGTVSFKKVVKPLGWTGAQAALEFKKRSSLEHKARMGTVVRRNTRRRSMLWAAAQTEPLPDVEPLVEDDWQGDPEGLESGMVVDPGRAPETASLWAQLHAADTDEEAGPEQPAEAGAAAEGGGRGGDAGRSGAQAEPRRLLPLAEPAALAELAEQGVQTEPEARLPPPCTAEAGLQTESCTGTAEAGLQTEPWIPGLAAGWTKRVSLDEAAPAAPPNSPPGPDAAAGLRTPGADSSAGPAPGAAARPDGAAAVPRKETVPRRPPRRTPPRRATPRRTSWSPRGGGLAPQPPPSRTRSTGRRCSTTAPAG